ncbi:MAG: hypothetical protein EKK63_09075 [Acinetobacter sp.]|uniref:hypothetical protein n=1 Tax=Acinetobacter sp. TaxID=472 RepID=UPI000FB0A0F2|nr:hypothetical protein [Acinetobacter sp.]RUP39780.1 MAG: hypothetical protein EKK63_09075 [Acinetobacter sp.]
MGKLVLTPDIKDTLLKNIKLRTAVAEVLDRSFYTIYRLVKNDDAALTSASVLLVLQEHTGKSQEELLTEVKTDSEDKQLVENLK